MTRALALLLLLAPGLAHGAVEMRAQVNATSVQVGDTFQLDVMITVENARGSGEPDELVQPDISDFELMGTDRAPTSSRTTIVQGQMTSTRTFGFVYYLRADSPGTKKIGAGRVRIGREVATSEPVTVVVLARGSKRRGGRSSELDPAARFVGKEVPPYFLDARFDRDEAWIGQQLVFTVRVYATEYIDLNLRELEPPKPPGFWVEVLDTPTRVRPTQRTIGGKQYLVYETMRVAMFPLEAGEHVLDALKIVITTTRGGWRRRHQVRLTSDPVAVSVKALPKDGQPPSFVPGNVGVWKLRAEVSETRVPEGQPVTLRLVAGGEGNLDGLTLPSLGELEGARVFPPTQSETKGVSGGLLHGEKTMEMLVQPLQRGRLMIPAFELAYFNPETERYETARSQPVVLDVVAAGAAAGASASGRARVEGVRPVTRGLRAASALHTPPYRQPAYLLALAMLGAVAVLGAGAGLWRAGDRAAPDAQRRRRARERHKELARAAEARDLAAAERVVTDALADRFGDEVRALASDQLGAHLTDRLPRDDMTALVAWLDAAQQSRYAPHGGADRRRLFDDAERLLDTLVEAS